MFPSTVIVNVPPLILPEKTLLPALFSASGFSALSSASTSVEAKDLSGRTQVLFSAERPR